MNNLIIYSLEIAISLALFFTAYWLFLKNETFFKLNRFYLVSSVLISLALPLLNITIGGDSVVSRIIISPIDRYEQGLLENFFLIKNGAFVNEASKTNLIKPKGAENKTEAQTASVLRSTDQNGRRSRNNINWLNICLSIYFIGVGLFLIRFIGNFIWIFSYILKNRPQQINGLRVIRSKKNISPFSFLHLVFIGDKQYADDELGRIISHEKVHIRQKHSWDLIFFELLLVFQWFNPFAWLYKRAVKINHEYLADEGTLHSGVDLPEYQYSLLNEVLTQNNFVITSSYNLSVKKRIAMMMQKRSPKLSALKMILVLPILFILFGAFAFNPAASSKLSQAQATMDPDSTIKEVKVPVTYLKMLEGEYVSTNDPNRERRIIFTELLGHLYGLDAGYNYKIIPVGGEKFVNPDDKAILLFDSKNKNAISLLLFGRITLNKVISGAAGLYKPNRAMGATIANVMLKSGVSEGLSYYQAAKDSSNYFLSEGDMNYAGYTLLQGGKKKEAAAILKLNTELFPNRYNTYDSYAEALLALGDKPGAIENYKKSLQLNPGSKSGLLHLKDLGVNTEGLVKKVALATEYLHLLEGDYLSTNEKNWVRWINLKEDKGVLYGTDLGYHYHLIPMGDGKFINPDDGESLVFDTKDKNNITMLLFGKVNLNKVKTVKESDVDLNKYAGTYLPPAENTILKPTEIFTKGNKLFRTIPSDAPGPNRTIELKMVTENTFFYADNSARSLEFILNDKKEVKACLLRRPDGVHRLEKQK